MHHCALLYGMARPLRIEYPGALYHITSRGDRREAIYLDDEDRRRFVALLGEVCDRFRWRMHAYCLMTNHYHLVAETLEGNLSRGMRQLNGVYTQRFNRRHGHVGHVFQGRYKTIVVQKDAYELELSRYVVLNPVRARLVAEASVWPWSNSRATSGAEPAPAWLETDWLLSQFGQDRRQAVRSYGQFVAEGVGAGSPWREVRNQIFLGDERFVSRLREEKRLEGFREIPKGQRQVLSKTLRQYQQEFPSRDEAMARAYHSGAYTMKEIGDFFGVHYMTVSRAVHKMLECET
jgi:putative transposase